MHESENLDAARRDPIDEPEAADEDLTNRWIAKLGDDSAALGEALERSSGIARSNEKSGGVVR